VNQLVSKRFAKKQQMASPIASYRVARLPRAIAVSGFSAPKILRKSRIACARSGAVSLQELLRPKQIENEDEDDCKKNIVSFLKGEMCTIDSGSLAPLQGASLGWISWG
jgi:transcription antitermination factor NusG